MDYSSESSTDQFISFISAEGKNIYSYILESNQKLNYFDDSDANPCCTILGVLESSCGFCPLQESISKNISVEIELQSADSQWWMVNVTPAFDLNGKRSGSFIMGRNSTQLKLQKAQAENSEAKYRLLFENSPEAIFIIQDGKFVFFNQKLSDITGYSKEELSEISVLNLLGKQSSFSDTQKINKLIKGFVAPQPIEIQVLNKEASNLWISLTTVSIEWENKPAILSFAYDVSAKTIATQLLEKQDAQYRLLVENQTDLLVNVDNDGRFIYVSPSYCELFGKTESELIGRSFIPLVHVEDRLSTNIEFEKLKNPPYSCYIEQRAFTQKGWRWLAWSDKAVRDEMGKIVSVIGVGRDIHEHKLAEIALLESERKLATLMSNLPGMVYRCKNDKSWTMEFVSNGCFELTEYSSADLINNNKLSFNDIIHPEHREDVWTNWQIAINQKQLYQGEYRIVTCKGKTKWVYEQGQAIFNAYGEMVALEGFIQDITARKLADEELSQTSEKFRNLIDTALVGIYTTTLQGELIFTNEALAEMLGYTVEEAYQIINVLTLYKHPNDRLDFISELQKQNSLTNVEKTWIHKSGKEITVLLSAVLSDNNLSGMVMDITHRKQHEIEVLKAKEKAIESDRLKSAFLANISHEIRTPVNGILGFLDIILDKETSNDEKDQYSSIVHKMSSQLLSIVNDVIEISKIETNQIVIRKVDFSVSDCLKSVYNQYVKYADKNNNQFLLPAENIPALNVNSDEGYIKQILGYLIDNSLKFTSNGRVEFGCRKTDDKVHFFVKDNGIGIHPRNHQIIFERFRQIEDSLTRKYNGSGLGLAISKALVELLGGKMSLVSEDGKGSEFSFTIPLLAQNNNIEDVRFVKDCLLNKKVLVCDDDDFGYLYIKKILTKAGLICLRAEDGPSAIELYNNTPQIDVIIMDLRLPGMTGIEAAKIISNMNSSIPILGFTAFAEDDIRSLKSQNLFKGFIFKPVDVPALLSLLRSLFS